MTSHAHLLVTGSDPPAIVARPPGPESRSWLVRASHVAAPMGPAPASRKGVVVRDAPSSSVVYSEARGDNVVDVDGNRYVDLAAGFGAMLLGHGHPAIRRVLELASARIFQALGDVHPSDAKIALQERLAALYPERGARVIVAQSGADAVTAALQTAVLATGRSGVIAFRGAYHGLSYAPLAACGLRESYREPFSAQLGSHVTFVSYPADREDAARSLEEVEARLSAGDVSAVLVEPVLGRGGCVVPPAGFLTELAALAKAHGALLVADEIWTGLGRTGSLLRSVEEGVVPDVFCLGKGLGGGLPLSACVGSDAVMRSWRREREVVQTSTFAGAPLACAAGIATLDVLSREKLVARSRELGARFLAELRDGLRGLASVADVRGVGLMIGIDLGPRPGAATVVLRRLLERGYLVSTGGGGREVVVLTPALTLGEGQIAPFVAAARDALEAPPS
ncbi:MAG TPA: aspartate aminotransferase family protein [Polyangiaceae bacterium]|nr:aspartate aminotransferase family protein [Polyangiaceae bacterium]